MEPVWAFVFLAVIAPFAVLCAVNDLTRMIIPNWVVAGLLICFLILAPFAMPLPQLGIRLIQVGVMFVLGVGLNAYLGIGGGDVKFAAVAAAFVAPSDYWLVVQMLAVLSLIAIIAHRQLGQIDALRKTTQTWASFSAGRKFPFGLPLAATLLAYQLLQVFRSF